MIRIGIAGAPGSGKTTLSRSLTNELHIKFGKDAQYVSEFARDHINWVKMKNSDIYTPNLTDQILFFDKQLERETLLPPSVEFVITDSPIFLSLIYTLIQCDLTNPQERAFYFHMYDKLIDVIFNHWTDYDHIFLLDNSKDYRQDGTRIQTEDDREDIGKRIQGFLDMHGIQYTALPADNDERIQVCLKEIGLG